MEMTEIEREYHYHETKIIWLIVFFLTGIMAEPDSFLDCSKKICPFLTICLSLVKSVSRFVKTCST